MMLEYIWRAMTCSIFGTSIREKCYDYMPERERVGKNDLIRDVRYLTL